MTLDQAQTARRDALNAVSHGTAPTRPPLLEALVAEGLVEPGRIALSPAGERALRALMLGEIDPDSGGSEVPGRDRG